MAARTRLERARANPTPFQDVALPIRLPRRMAVKTRFERARANPTVFEAVALPIRLLHQKKMVTVTGFEPATTRLKVWWLKPLAYTVIITIVLQGDFLFIPEVFCSVLFVFFGGFIFKNQFRNQFAIFEALFSSKSNSTFVESKHESQFRVQR